MVENLQKYLGTKTIIKVISQEHWDLLIANLRQGSGVTKFKSKDYKKYGTDTILIMDSKGTESCANRDWVKKNNKYLEHISISSSKLFPTSIKEIWF